eukprot:299749-Rhodomonas_salina.1
MPDATAYSGTKTRVSLRLLTGSAAGITGMMPVARAPFCHGQWNSSSEPRRDAARYDYLEGIRRRSSGCQWHLQLFSPSGLPRYAGTRVTRNLNTRYTGVPRSSGCTWHGYPRSRKRCTRLLAREQGHGSTRYCAAKHGVHTGYTCTRVPGATGYPVLIPGTRGPRAAVVLVAEGTRVPWYLA